MKHPARDIANRDATTKPLSRRRVLAAAACSPLLAVGARTLAAPERALPIRNLGLEHLDILVPDTAASARFYRQVFNAALYQQEFRGTIRYFVLLGELPPDRQVGYIAIGAGFDRPIQIGHYCALAETADFDALAEELTAAGYPPPGGGFSMIPDPDGLELQLFTPPAGLVSVAVPSELATAEDGLFTPTGMDHILLRVADLDRSLAYYRFVYGEGLERPDPDRPGRIWFELEADTRLGLEAVAAGDEPHIERFGIKVAPFDHAAATTRLRDMGVEILSDPERKDRVRFRDNYAITLQVNAA